MFVLFVFAVKHDAGVFAVFLKLAVLDRGARRHLTPRRTLDELCIARLFFERGIAHDFVVVEPFDVTPDAARRTGTDAFHANAASLAAIFASIVLGRFVRAFAAAFGSAVRRIRLGGDAFAVAKDIAGLATTRISIVSLVMDTFSAIFVRRTIIAAVILGIAARGTAHRLIGGIDAVIITEKGPVRAEAPVRARSIGAAERTGTVKRAIRAIVIVFKITALRAARLDI